MDAAVGLVQAYLRSNGFLTVTEHPIMERGPDGRMREATDIDIIAVRLAGAGRVLPRALARQGAKMDADPVLDVDWHRTEIIIAEVKEGPADVNRALLRRRTLAETLRRFGLAPREQAKDILAALYQHGEATWDGHRIQLLVFGGRPPSHAGTCRFIPLGDAIDHLEAYIDGHRAIGASPRFRDDVLALLAMRRKVVGG